MVCVTLKWYSIVIIKRKNGCNETCLRIFCLGCTGVQLTNFSLLCYWDRWYSCNDAT